MTLSDPDVNVRIAFVKKVATHGDVAVVPQLLRALDDDDELVRSEAVLGLRNWREDPNVVDALVQVVLDDFHSTPRMNAASVLSKSAVFRQWFLDAMRSPETRERANELIGDDGIRHAVHVYELRRSGDLEMLIACLRHGTLEVRLDAAEALGEIGDPKAVPALEQVSADEEIAGVQSAAAAALERIRLLSEGDTIDGLIDRLRATDIDKRLDAVMALGKERSPRAFDAMSSLLSDIDWLFPYLASETGKKIKSPPESLALKFPTALIDALISTSDSRVVEVLVDALNHREPAVRLAAARGLGSLRDERAQGPLALVAKNDAYKFFPDMSSNEVLYPVREAAEEALAALSTAAGGGAPVHTPEQVHQEETHDVAQLLELLREAFRRNDLKAADKIERSLRKVGGADIEVLTRALTDEVTYDGARVTLESEWVRRTVVELMGDIGGVETLPALREALDDDDDQLRVVATKAIEGIMSRATQDVAQLLELLREALREGDQKAADKITRSLRKAAPGDVRALTHGLSDDNPMVRWTIVDVMGDIGGVETLPVLREALNDPDDGVREAASVALERIESR